MSNNLEPKPDNAILLHGVCEIGKTNNLVKE